MKKGFKFSIPLFTKNNKNDNTLSDEQNKEKIKEKIQNYQSNRNKEDLKFIYQIYDEAYNNIQVNENHKRFIKSIGSNTQFYNYYSIKQLQEKHKMLKLFSKYREVRGDGNCFYTAFGFRFLQILLGDQNLEQFLFFLDKIESINLTFRINFKAILIPEDIQKKLLKEFLLRICQIRLIEDKQERLQILLDHYQAYEPKDDNIDGCFFALTTIFFRNISFYLASISEMKEQIFDKDNLLIWGQECNNNEIIIKEFSEFFRVMVVVVYIDKGTISSMEYSGELHYHQILLLFQPGHYNIGLE